MEQYNVSHRLFCTVLHSKLNKYVVSSISNVKNNNVASYIYVEYYFNFIKINFITKRLL